MADLLLGQAYYLRFDPKLCQAQQPYAPLGTLYAAASCASAATASRCSTRCSRESDGEWGDALERAAPARRRDLRRQLQLPEQDVPAAHARGGARDDRSRARARGVPDRRVRDRTPPIIRSSISPRRRRRHPRRRRDDARRSRRSPAARARPIEDVPGIALPATMSCAVRRTSARPFIKSLDALPFPAWDLVDVDRYRAIWHGAPRLLTR